MRDCLSVYPLAITTSEVCYLGRLADCNRSGCDQEGDIDWHMSYTVTVRSLNPTQSNPIFRLYLEFGLLLVCSKYCTFFKPSSKMAVAFSDANLILDIRLCAILAHTQTLNVFLYSRNYMYNFHVK